MLHFNWVLICCIIDSKWFVKRSLRIRLVISLPKPMVPERQERLSNQVGIFSFFFKICEQAKTEQNTSRSFTDSRQGRQGRPAVVCAISWVLAGLISSLPFLDFSSYKKDPLGVWCHVSMENGLIQLIYLGLSYSTLFITPVIIIFVLHLKVQIITDNG